jgi:carboxyl-terminal processing protease
MRKWMVLVMLGLGGQGWAATNSINEAWRKTDLDLSLSKLFITNAKCAASEDVHQSCIEAVDAANKLLTNPLTLGHKDFESELAQIAQKLPAEVPPQMMLGAAINAHLTHFDPHALLHPSALAMAQPYAPGSAGIGTIVRKFGEGYLVTDILAGSSADLAKMAIGDVITTIAGTSAQNDESEDELFHAASGPAGSVVGVTYSRGGETHRVNLVRGPIIIQNVESRHDLGDASIAYIRIRHFDSGTTCKRFTATVNGLKGLGAKKLILDLRDNGGGNTAEALCVGGLFTGNNAEVAMRFIGPQIREVELVHAFDQSPGLVWMGGSTLFADPIPLVILIDGLTASAAEIVAGAVQFAHVGWVVGERSFGKGSLQTVEYLPGHDSLTLNATTARFYFANLLSNQRVGITPSFEIPLAQDHPLAPVNREAEVFPNSLPAVNEPWADSRTDEIAKIRACVVAGSLDQKFLSATNGDYQKAYAAAVLSCSDPQK